MPSATKAIKSRRDATRLGATVYGHLRNAILGGDYDVRTHISDIAIAKELHVSRTPVREALARLEEEGLISRGGPRRLVVSSITPEEVAHIYPIVAVLEGLAGYLATPQVTAADLRELRTLDARMQAAAKAFDVPTFFKANAAFHEVFIRRATNPRLEKEIGKFRLLMRRLRVFLMKIPGRMTMSAEEHAAIIQAFAARDAQQAETAIRRHITSAEQALRQALEAVRELT